MPGITSKARGCCPFHPEQPEQASAYHCICKCPANAIKRKLNLITCLDSINAGLISIYEKQKHAFPPDRQRPLLTENLLRALLTPQYEGLFKFGKPPLAMENWFINSLGKNLAQKMAPTVNTSTKKFYHSCWIDYCDSIHRKKFNFSNQLKNAYGIKPHDITSKKEEIWRNRDPIMGQYDPDLNL